MTTYQWRLDKLGDLFARLWGRFLSDAHAVVARQEVFQAVIFFSDTSHLALRGLRRVHADVGAIHPYVLLYCDVEPVAVECGHVKGAFRMGRCQGTENLRKHDVPFSKAQLAFADPRRVIAQDLAHSQIEQRFYCFGRVDDGIMTVRFTYRTDVIRIIGAGYWRKGKAIHEQENKVHG